MATETLRIHLFWGTLALLLAGLAAWSLLVNAPLDSPPGVQVATVPTRGPQEPGFEDELANQLTTQAPVVRQAQPDLDFAAQLSAAIGMEAFVLPVPPRQFLTTESTQEMGEGHLLKLAFHFDQPLISSRGWLWRHSTQPEQLVVLLHGHNTTARMALGMDGDDYMRGIGRQLFQDGHDVLAFELSNDGIVSGYINARLALWGGQIYGLWATTVCAGSHAVVEQFGYQRSILYGLSNGGYIADIVSVLCDLFATVIVDDILTDWPAHANAHTNQLFQHQQYAVYYLTSFLATLDYLDFLRFSRCPKVYTRTASYVDEQLGQSLWQSFSRGPLGGGEKISLVYKKRSAHEPEWPLIQAIIHQDWQELDGHALRPQ